MLKGMQFRRHVRPRLFREGNFVLERADNWLEPSPKQTARGRNFSANPSPKVEQMLVPITQVYRKRNFNQAERDRVTRTKYFIFYAILRRWMNKIANFVGSNPFLSVPFQTYFSCERLKSLFEQPKIKKEMIKSLDTHGTL